MKYRLVERGNPANPAEPKKWYANPVNVGKFMIRDFAKEIAGRLLLTRGDIENTLDNFPEELPAFLKIGMSIRPGEFGTLRLNLSSEGTDTPEAFNAACIKGVKVIFTPSMELKKALEDIPFEEAK
ncbi:MAG: DNA-binding protein [Proteiniphilum sp.]|jgi:predicted histone-like DNA-binding protein|nr:DNA-binding protein [Proteiniphilum sp.]